jgi:hypothetical protein
MAGPEDTITLDGTAVGRERFDSSVAPGAHALRVTASGMKPYEVSLDLGDDATRTVQVTLEKERGAVWPWIAAGVVVAAGLGVGAYFIFKPSDHQAEQPPGNLQPGLVNMSRFR